MNSGTSSRPLPTELAEQIALLAAFLLSSGRGLLEEPTAYGPARCADGARRTLELLERYGPCDARLVALRTRLEEAMSGPMGEVDLVALLDDACDRMAEVLSENR
ncbi:DUF6092 family protein [Streptomyces tsukubensis]|uniref:Uncharacterized protein n=1 Tax=Streptomyces tsukubensis TaxID=83656 RepID=A0A1V3ZZV8_9ACTN|nr:DUF6092 family protein [Streptomyces tsukubensis]OON72073.1 hypothetical protein B1H18_31345 [Streptomyces tsukubensis]QFR93293.1 hypothetical protein GBW32_09580 [Streptomyces tsukubensis]